MVQRRDLNAPPGQKLADVVKALREKAESSKTGAHGVKHMGEHGDVTWPGTGPDGQPVTKSVKRFSVELDDTTAQADELAEKLDEARDVIDRASKAGDRIYVASGYPPADSIVGKTVWLSPSGHQYIRVECES